MRSHLEQVYKQTGRMPKELESPNDFPILLVHVWSAFVALSNTRAPGFSSASPISYRDIKDWMDVTNNKLSPRDVEAVIEIDRLYLKVNNG